MYNMTTGYLEHFGIKGMHWGIRHDKEYEKSVVILEMPKPKSTKTNLNNYKQKSMI